MHLEDIPKNNRMVATEDASGSFLVAVTDWMTAGFLSFDSRLTSFADTRRFMIDYELLEYNLDGCSVPAWGRSGAGFAVR